MGEPTYVASIEDLFTTSTDLTQVYEYDHNILFRRAVNHPINNTGATHVHVSVGVIITEFETVRRWRKRWEEIGFFRLTDNGVVLVPSNSPPIKWTGTLDNAIVYLKLQRGAQRGTDT